MYANGQGVPQDYAEAMKWYRKAADQGDDTAQYNLGLMYYNGRGVPQDYVAAHKWFSLAAARATGGLLLTGCCCALIIDQEKGVVCVEN